MANYASAASGLPIRVGLATDVAASDGMWDCITMTDVLEHTMDPVGALRAVRAGLREGGLLFASVPNWMARSRVESGKEWSQFVSDHYFYFSESTIASIALQAGFTAVATKTDLAVPAARLRHPPAARLLRKASAGAHMSWSTDGGTDALYLWAVK